MKSFLFLGLALACLSFPSADLVESHLPGCNTDVHQFSGYLNVSTGKELHYVLVESQDKWNKDPLLIWLHGGPGCSAMMAFVMDHGPCVFDENNDTIFENPFPWNKRANVLYIEGPAGVGYSYAQTTADKQFNDIVAADDFLKALNSFFVKFPEFAG